MICFLGAKMDFICTLHLTTFCVTLIYLTYGETQLKLTEKTLLDTVVEKCHYIQGEKVDVPYIVDADNGTVTAKFYSPKLCNHTEYEIELQIFEDNNESCLGILNNEEMLSKKYWDSSEDGEIMFKNVFSGCYRFQIKPLINSNSLPSVYSDVKYIKTNVSKTSITKQSIKIATKYNPKISSLEVNILMEFVPEKTVITLAAVGHQHSSTEESCRKHSVDHSHCDVFDASSKCNATGNFTVPECNKVSEKISCTFFNVTPGFHCVTITAQDDRCIEHSVFKPELCTWRTESAIAVDGGLRDTPEVKVNTVSAFYLTLVTIVTIIILFFTGVIIYMFKKRQPMITILDEPMDEVIPMVSKKKVLLLYPRDCEQFMTVMKSFRELLEKSHNIEVFDCYNDDDVLDGPLDWLQSKLRNPNFYVLIVISRCSYLHQEAIFAGDWGSSYSLYRDPAFLDKIFIYGLRWVMKDISANPFFCKKFLIGFRGFSEDEDILSVPVNWTRYIIPDHLDRLLTDMNIYISPAGNLNNTVQHVNLESEIHCLRRFKSENPYYLSGILAI